MPPCVATSSVSWSPCSMQNFTATVRSRVGLHARPAAVFVKAASRFKSTITVCNATTGAQAVNGKSILLVLTLGVEQGHAITVTASGADEAEAAAALRETIAAGSGESE
jgi:phosphotransferase system HPr (HPr) family protein